MFSILRVSLIFILFSITHAHLVIDIEPEEMQRIAEILVENYLANNLTPQTAVARNTVLSHIKKISFGIIQLFGITISLVSANLLTSLFEPTIVTPPEINSNSVNITNHETMEMCNRDFGCSENVCWRSCDAGSTNQIQNKNNQKSYCYTTPKPESHKYQQCIYAHDCSPCWECLGSCHYKKTIV